MIDLADPLTYEEWDRYLAKNARARCAYWCDPLTVQDVVWYFSGGDAE